MIRLHEMAHSPFCIPVKRFLEAHAIPFEAVEVSNWDRRALIRLTGGEYYQVPVIEHDGKVVFETPSDPLAVAHYLDTAFAGGRLFPEHCAGLQEIVIDHIENTLEGLGFKLIDPAYVDGIQDQAERVMVIRFKERKFGPGCVEKWRADAAAMLAAFEAALEPYERRLVNAAFLFGDERVYADYALLGVLGNFQHGGHHRLDARHTGLHRWMEAMKK
jgi:glutathione S-transferase